MGKEFAECGEIDRLNMPMNDEGRPKGIAFITYKSEEAVAKALEFNETDYGGRTLKVNKAGDRPAKGKDKDGKGKDGKGKGKDGKGKGKKGKKEDAEPPAKKAKKAKPPTDSDDDE